MVTLLEPQQEQHQEQEQEHLEMQEQIKEAQENENEAVKRKKQEDGNHQKASQKKTSQEMESVFTTKEHNDDYVNFIDFNFDNY